MFKVTLQAGGRAGVRSWHGALTLYHAASFLEESRMMLSPGPVPPDPLIGTTWAALPASPTPTYCLERCFIFLLVDVQNPGNLAHLYGLVLDGGGVRAPRTDLPGSGTAAE